MAPGGVLTLSQSATGGAGGSSDTGTGGAGGAASSTLSLTESATPSAVLNMVLQATGGAAGAGATAGQAGAATATGAANGMNTVNLNVTAVGGVGPSAGGGATATAIAVGQVATSNATASVQTTAGAAVAALATSTGVSAGSIAATEVASASDAIAGGVVTLAQATASNTAIGVSNGVAGAQNNTTPLAFTTSPQSVAEVTALPSAASFASVLAANTTIASAMGAGATALAIGELGGGHSNGPLAPQTESSSIAVTLDTTKLSPTQHLELGLYGGAVTGSGVNSVLLDVNVGGVDVFTQTFTTPAAALAYFKNQAIDLGVAGSAGSVTATVTLSVTTAWAGSTFDTNIVLGAKAAAFASAMSTGASGSAAVLTTTLASTDGAPQLVTPG